MYGFRRPLICRILARIRFVLAFFGAYLLLLILLRGAFGLVSQPAGRIAAGGAGLALIAIGATEFVLGRWAHRRWREMVTADPVAIKVLAWFRHGLSMVGLGILTYLLLRDSSAMPETSAVRAAFIISVGIVVGMLAIDRVVMRRYVERWHDDIMQQAQTAVGDENRHA